jgi:hypothetical protein
MSSLVELKRPRILEKKMNKWDYIKLKRFFTAKKKVTRIKRLDTEWEKTFASYSFENGLKSRIYRKQKTEPPKT